MKSLHNDRPAHLEVEESIRSALKWAQFTPTYINPVEQKFSQETSKGINVLTRSYIQKYPALHVRKALQEFQKQLLYPTNSLWIYPGTDISWTTVSWP